MNLELPDIAAEVGATASRAFAEAGGVDLARRAEAGEAVDVTVDALLGELGAFDVQVGTDGDVDAAAGELCRAAGRIVLPYPLAGVLASEDGRDRPTVLVDPAFPRADHGGLFPSWRAVALDGSAWDASPTGSPLTTKLGPFVSDLTLGAEAAASVDASPSLVLGGWYLVGVCERALELAIEHVSSRHQFGHALAGFQSVQFQIADVAVTVQSLRELARYTMWRLSSGEADRLVDALALRVQALETTTQVLRTCVQLHGAIGLCDEHDLSILVRHAQPILRLPCGMEATTEHLITAIGAQGFDSLFNPEGVA